MLVDREIRKGEIYLNIYKISCNLRCILHEDPITRLFGSRSKARGPSEVDFTHWIALLTGYMKTHAALQRDEFLEIS